MVIEEEYGIRTPLRGHLYCITYANKNEKENFRPKYKIILSNKKLENAIERILKRYPETYYSTKKLCNGNLFYCGLRDKELYINGCFTLIKDKSLLTMWSFSKDKLEILIDNLELPKLQKVKKRK